MKFILNLPNAQELTKEQLKNIKGGDYVYHLNGYEVHCSKPFNQVLTCNNIPTYCLISPDMCPTGPF